MPQRSYPSPRSAKWEKYHRFADRTSPKWESRTRGSNETIAIITRRLGPYAQAWATWLRRIAPGAAPTLGRAADLEMGMAKLLQGTD